jgi:hypothetical protein
VFYVGRTCDLHRRSLEHLCDKSKTYKANKIQKLKINDLPIEFNELHVVDDFDESVTLEIQVIKEYKDRGIKLTNLTDGGEGLYGVTRVFTEEWKNNLKRARKQLFKDGYIVANKDKTLEELIGPKKAKEQKKRVGKKISEGIKNGTINHNKGKFLEDIVGCEVRVKEIKKINSETAKKTFTGTKQSEEHIKSRSISQSVTKQNWSKEKRAEISNKYRLAQIKAAKRYDFVIDDNFKHYGTWKSLSLALKEELGIIVGPQPLSDFHKGKTKANRMNCGISTIQIL